MKSSDSFKQLIEVIEAGASAANELIKNMSKQEICKVDDRTGATILHFVAACKHQGREPYYLVDIVRTLLNKEPDLINQCTKQYKGNLGMIAPSGSTPLHRAIGAHNWNVAQLLLKHKPALANQMDSGYTALHVMAMEAYKNNSLEKDSKDMPTFCSTTARLLLDNMDQKAICAISRRDIIHVRRDMDQEAIDAAVKDSMGRGSPALHKAVENGNIELVGLLLFKMNQEGIDAIDGIGKTALFHVKDEKMTQILIAKMTPEAINVVDKNGQTALHNIKMELAIAADVLITKMTPEAINAVDKNGQTALHNIIVGDKKNEVLAEKLITKMSIEAINTVNERGSLLMYCGEHEKLAGLLIARMTPETINAVNKNGQTALHIALTRLSSNIKLITVLLSAMHQESINAFDIQGRTALEIATSRKLDDVIKLINNRLAFKTVNNEGENSIDDSNQSSAKQDEDKTTQISRFEQLVAAINSNDTSGARKLIAQMKKDELTAIDLEGKTALHLAAEKDNDAIAKSLLAKNPSLFSIEDYSENTALILAEIYESHKVLQILGNFTGKGSKEHEEESYWYEYSKEGVSQILPLRLENSYIEGVKIADSILWDDSLCATEKLTSDIISKLERKEDRVLVPVNLYGQHWVGVAIEKIADKITITYMDSEQKETPALLKKQLLSQIATHFSECQITIIKPELELQKYNNCGVETIENFLLYLTGYRLPQEKALEFHSGLLEEKLTNLGHYLSDNIINNDPELLPAGAMSLEYENSIDG